MRPQLLCRLWRLETSEQSDSPANISNSKPIVLAVLIKQGPDLSFTRCLFYSLIIFISASLKLLRLLGNVKESCIDFSLNSIPSLFSSSMSSLACWLTCGGEYSMSGQSRALSAEPRLPDLRSFWCEGLDLERLDCILRKSPLPFLSKSISVVKKKKIEEGEGVVVSHFEII